MIGQTGEVNDVSRAWGKLYAQVLTLYVMLHICAKVGTKPEQHRRKRQGTEIVLAWAKCGCDWGSLAAYKGSTGKSSLRVSR